MIKGTETLTDHITLVADAAHAETTACFDQDHRDTQQRIYCPICRSDKVSEFIAIDRLPVHCSALLPTADEARAAATGRISLAYCHRCGFVHNQQFEAEKVVFEPGYEASLAHSSTFRSYVQDLVNRLVDRYDLHDKCVLEIGCGDGFFLRQLCERGGNTGIGVDPTIKLERCETAGKGSVRFISDYFSDRYQHLISAFVCSMSVFETVPNPRAFLTELSDMIAKRDGVIVYFEVPNADYMFNNKATWSIYYEQFGHFTQNTLTSLFSSCGYEVLDSGSCYEDGQYVYVEAKLRASTTSKVDPFGDDWHELPVELRTFAEAQRDNFGFWRGKLEQLNDAGKKITTWGSGGKGNSFLNLLNTDGLVRYVVDINPERQGKFIPGSAQMIVGPSFLAEYRPDVIIITNPIYEQEIRQQVSALGVSCEFMTV